MEPNGILAKRSAYGQNLMQQHGARPPMDHAGVHNNLTQSLLTAASELASNATAADDGGEISKFGRPLLTFAAVATIAIMAVGIAGNLLTIVALLKCPKVRNVAAAFIISLCLADCLFCVLVLPFNAMRFISGTWSAGDLLCRLVPFVQYGNVGVSLLCIAMITINRYIMITHHSVYARIYKKHWITAMILFCWALSYGMQLPTLFSLWGRFGYDEKLGTCSILRDSSGRSSKTALFVTAFAIPCVIIIICYARIFWVVHESEVRMRRHANSQNSVPNNLRPMPAPLGQTSIAGASNNNHPAQRLSSQSNVSSTIDSETAAGAVDIPASPPPTPSAIEQPLSSTALRPGASLQQKISRVKDRRDAKAKRNEWRITKMVLAIFLSFVACYLPITLVKIADTEVRWPTLHVLAYIMVYLSACINPIIYVIMNKQYRQAYKTVLLCKPASRLLAGFTQGGGNASSVGEKWKDIGYSYNHSRTMVSQVSIAEASDTSATSDLRPQPSATDPQRSSTHRVSSALRDSTRPNSTRLPVIPDSNELHI